MMNPYDVDDDQHYYELSRNILNFYLNFVFRPVMKRYKKSRTFKTHQLATNKLGEKNRWLKEAIFLNGGWQYNSIEVVHKCLVFSSCEVICVLNFLPKNYDIFLLFFDFFKFILHNTFICLRFFQMKNETRKINEKTSLWNTFSLKTKILKQFIFHSRTFHFSFILNNKYVGNSLTR